MKKDSEINPPGLSKGHYLERGEVINPVEGVTQTGMGELGVTQRSKGCGRWM